MIGVSICTICIPELANTALDDEIPAYYYLTGVLGDAIDCPYNLGDVAFLRNPALGDHSGNK